ncbi:MAG TPA: histone-like nucleoid-structuring protein Lsr2 [Acidimicrobiales bacterium]|nr:histone-like nucleoid-structuring protein Lsr2 [Acidimicrobiales bacterium]
MAKTTVTVLTCDQCQAEAGEEVEAEESVALAYDGYNYELDLCAPHAQNFHDTLQTLAGWASERSRMGRRSRRTASSASQAESGSGGRTTGDRERLRAIREWARENGYPDLGNRGRIPQHVVAEYEAAHGG